MEDVLAVYERKYDPEFPVVCMDEKCKSLIATTREEQAQAPGRPMREDYEYKQLGSINLFLEFEPLTGDCHVEVTEQRRKNDWAHFMRDLAEERYAGAKRIVVVLDNLNVHGPASFYEAFVPDEARRLVERFEFHPTPKHGSWLNMAEIGLCVLDRECLNRRLRSREEVASEVTAWEKRRDHRLKIVDWRFTTKDARQRLGHLYPTIAPLK